MSVFQIDKSPTLQKYKDTMMEYIQMYYPDEDRVVLSNAIDYSIRKRMHNASNIKVINSYTKENTDWKLLDLADWIATREPIVTSHGTMFKKHEEVPNPLTKVWQLFLDKRTEDKDIMKSYPKGSEQYEKYNLFQQLDKIDANGLYGILGMFTCMIFNIHTAASVTAQGRSLISAVTMFFESFLNNNVKFGSLDEVVNFMNNVRKEKRTYDDNLVLDHFPTVEECFAKLVMSCGYRWIPDDDELDIIWKMVNNLSQVDLNRIYYKNNLFEFLENKSAKKAIIYIMKKLKNPFFNSLKPPKEIRAELEEFTSLIKEYVYYDKMIMDRIIRCDSMIKSTIMISDTDSCIVSLDAWYRFALNVIKDEEIGICRFDPIDVLEFIKHDELGDIEESDFDKITPFCSVEKEEHYDFENDEIYFEKKAIDPFVITTHDYLRYSIINIMGFVIDGLVNDYLEKFTKNNHSYQEGRPCRIILKNEFTFARILMSLVKKAYACDMRIQEGNVIPVSERLDIKGIDKMAKSSTPKNTRDTFKAILLEDILNADTIDQFRIIEKLAIMEKKILTQLEEGDISFYKPVTIKAINKYDDPMRQYGVKAAVAWNYLKDEGMPGINLEERNAIYVANMDINPKNVERLEEEYPEVYHKMTTLMKENEFFKKGIGYLALPLDTQPPKWFIESLDQKSIVHANVGGFLYDSVGLLKMSDNTNYSNILQL